MTAAQGDGAISGDVSVSAEHNESVTSKEGRAAFWGHGIGYEELLLLGLMVFLMNECDGEGDFKETLILLGLLLLGG